MKKYLTITVREQMQGMTVEKVLYDYLELTKKQVSRAKFRPDGQFRRIQPKINKADTISLILCLLNEMKFVYAWKQMKYSLHSWFWQRFRERDCVFCMKMKTYWQ